MWAVLTASERYTPPAWRSRGSYRVALGFVEGMAAVRFLLLVVVERHSSHSQRCESVSWWHSYLTGVFCGEAAMLYLDVRAIVVVLVGVPSQPAVVGLFVNTLGCMWQSRVLATPTWALGR
jgi:hypothetical protein